MATTPNAVLRTSSRWDNAVKHLGYISVNHPKVTNRNITDVELVTASQERLRGVRAVNDNDLTNSQKKHLELAREIVRNTSEGVLKVNASIIPPASDRVRTAGMYGKTLKEIYISLEQLDYGGRTVDTIIHEIAHHTSGVEDLERGHADEMTRIAARVVQGVSLGQYDDIIKSPDFKWY